MRINKNNPVPVITSKTRLNIKNVDILIGEEMNWVFELAISITRDGKIKNRTIVGTHKKRRSSYIYSKNTRQEIEYREWLKGKKKWLKEK